MIKGKGMFVTTVFAALGGALIYIISKEHPNFYDVFTRMVDVPGYWFMITCVYEFLTKDGRRH